MPLPRLAPRSTLPPLLLLLLAGLSGCMVGPTYHRPTVASPPAYKESEGWAPATPSDAADRGDWWTVFGDPTLNDLEAKLLVSNQTLAAAEAGYRQARALTSESRAALFPTVSLDASATRAYSGAPVTGGTHATYQPSVGASWAPDLWGAVRRTIQNAKASEQASAATLAGARLSARTELALDYINLRQLDEETRIFAATTKAYARSLEIAQNKYAAGVVSRGDVLTARTQLLNAQAQSTDLIQQRARLEHAIAILTGAAPGSFSLPPAPWALNLPSLPTSTPSQLLQRRPDIATAERNAAAASALIGVQVAAWFPNVTLTGQAGSSAGELAQLFSASTNFWSLGAGAAETVFDAGARAAKVRAAHAAYDQAVANYRQTVLAAFGQVEDNLAAQRVLATEEGQLAAASDAASANEAVARDEYAAGTVDFTTVATAEAAALSARNALLSAQASRLATAVDPIEALGGGWNAAKSPGG